MTAAGSARRDGAEQVLSIGGVLTQLRAEFPDITISKIRFLESEGLLRPARTASGYRQFNPADVQRLRYVLAAQRDYYLPLRVIKEQLDAADNQRDPSVAVHGPCPSTSSPQPVAPGGARGTGPSLPGPEDFAVDSGTRLSADELVSAADVDVELLGEIERYGLISPDAAGSYDGDAVVVAGTVRAMTRFGIEPRHLRAFRASADREVGLLEQVLTPVYQQRGTDASARADEMARELATLAVTLHTLLVKSGIRGMAGS